jgi:hypothetical protein
MNAQLPPADRTVFLHSQKRDGGAGIRMAAMLPSRLTIVAQTPSEERGSAHETSLGTQTTRKKPARTDHPRRTKPTATAARCPRS